MKNKKSQHTRARSSSKTIIIISIEICFTSLDRTKLIQRRTESETSLRGHAAVLATGQNQFSKNLLGTNCQ